MSFADSSATRLAYIAESTENTIPTTPTWQTMRYTQESFNRDKITKVSEEIRADGNVPNVTDVGFRVPGGFGFELSYGTLDPLLESLLFSTWSSDVLKNGITPKSFAWEKTFETGGTDQYLRYTGMQMNEISLEMQAEEIIKGSATLMGRGHATDTAIITGATYSAANTNEPMACSGDVGSLSIGSLSPTPTLLSASITITKNLGPRLAVANAGPVGIRSGRFIVTGSLEAYFESLGLYNACLNHDDLAIALTLGSVANEKYTISLPKTKLMNAVVQASGNDQDVMVNSEFQAIYDSSSSATISITRAVA